MKKTLVVVALVAASLMPALPVNAAASIKPSRRNSGFWMNTAARMTPRKNRLGRPSICHLFSPVCLSRTAGAARKKFLSEVNAKADAYTEKMAESLPPRQTVPRAMKIKYHFDAVLDGLILLLEPK